MKKLFILVFIFISPVIFAFAQDENKNDTSVEMREIEVGPGSKVLIPKGVKYHKEGAQLVIEDYSQYLERRLKSMDERITQVKEAVLLLKSELEQLKESLDNIQASLNAKVNTKQEQEAGQ